MARYAVNSITGNDVAQGIASKALSGPTCKMYLLMSTDGKDVSDDDGDEMVVFDDQETDIAKVFAHERNSVVERAIATLIEAEWVTLLDPAAEEEEVPEEEPEPAALSKPGGAPAFEDEEPIDEEPDDELDESAAPVQTTSSLKPKTKKKQLPAGRLPATKPKPKKTKAKETPKQAQRRRAAAAPPPSRRPPGGTRPSAERASKRFKDALE